MAVERPPYVIATQLPFTALGGYHGPNPAHRVVATLREARDQTAEIVRQHVEYDDEDRGTDRFVSEAMTFLEAGATIGPLPDGTVIVVTRKET